MNDDIQYSNTEEIKTLQTNFDNMNINEGSVSDDDSITDPGTEECPDEEECPGSEDDESIGSGCFICGSLDLEFPIDGNNHNYDGKNDFCSLDCFNALIEPPNTSAFIMAWYEGAYKRYSPTYLELSRQIYGGTFPAYMDMNMEPDTNE